MTPWKQALTGVSYQPMVSESLHGSEPQCSLQHPDLAGTTPACKALDLEPTRVAS